MPPAISDEIRQKIVTMYQHGLSIRAISRDLLLSRNTVALWVRRYAEEGNISDRRQNNRRPAALSEMQRKEMLRDYEKDGSIPTQQYAERFDVNPKTIRRHLHSMKLNHKVPANKVEMAENQKTASENLAHQYLELDWSSTIFTDAKTFQSHKHGQRNNSPRKVDQLEDQRQQDPDAKRVKTEPKPSYAYTLNSAGELHCTPCDRIFKSKIGFASHIRALHNPSKN